MIYTITLNPAWDRTAEVERLQPGGTHLLGAVRGDAGAFAEQISAWEAFREEAFQFAVDEGFDHPAFTDWVWPEAAEQGDTDGALSATQLTAGDNE